MNQHHYIHTKSHRTRLTLGAEAENWVASIISTRGWELIEKNWRRRGTEIDIIARKECDLLFIEVKARTRMIEDDCTQLLPPSKLRAIHRGIEAFLGKHPSTDYTTIRVFLAFITCNQTGFQCRWIPLENLLSNKD